MTQKLLKFFTIFIIIGAVGIIFIYLYRVQVDLMVEKYVSKITVCGNILSEEDCYAKEFCEGIYGPSCPTCVDLEFKRCQRPPLQTVVKIEGEKELCQSSGGQWYRNKLGNFCLCEKSPSGNFFDKTKGCINK